MRLAWFSPLPPTLSGIAAYSAELVPRLRADGVDLDPFPAERAHDFVWQQRRRPYDLIVYQLGNALCHSYMWAYLFRYPGLVVLHDAQLHQARALALTRRWIPRRDDYLEEFRANHPDAPPAIGELIAAGLGGSLYAHWPHTRLVVESARMTVVHNRRLCEALRTRHPHAAIEPVAMGVADPLAALAGMDGGRAAAAAVKARHDMPADAVVVVAFGGVTPEKRIGPLIRAVRAIAERDPNVYLLLVGPGADHFDALDEAQRAGVADRVRLAGFVADADLPAYLAAADVCACLRWPSNRETSASWLRCLAAGRATLITDLTDLAHVPTLDPRGWQRADVRAAERQPVAVRIDIVDEDRSLQLALERLTIDPALRARLGEAARAWWTAHHRLDAMTRDYRRVLTAAAGRPAPRPRLPRHLTDDGSEHGRAIAARLQVIDRLGPILEPPGRD